MGGAWIAESGWQLLPFNYWEIMQFSSVQSLTHVWLLATPWTTAGQASLSINNSQSPPKPTSIELVMPSNYLILCRSLLLPLSVVPSIRVFSSGSALCIMWPKYWSFSFNISPSSEHPGLISFRMDWLDLLAVPRGFWKSSPTLQFKSINSLVLNFFIVQLSYAAGNSTVSFLSKWLQALIQMDRMGWR